MFVDCTDILIYGYVVVVDYEKQVRIVSSRIVQPLKRKTSGKRTVSDQRDGPAAVTPEPGSLGKPEGSGYGCGCMAPAEGVIFAFRHFRKAAYTVFFPVVAECLPPASNDFVGIRLMPYVKHDPVFWSIIHVMKSYDKLHSPETGAEMPRID